MMSIFRFIFLLACISCKHSNTINKPKPVGGRCEFCESIFESPVEFDRLSNSDTLPDFNDRGRKLHISGVIYERDGHTPAAGVVLYIYHTDQTGIYRKKADSRGPHGYIRGWIKTKADGHYDFYTLIPGAYPGRSSPKHIHPLIKEPGKTVYWIEDFYFDDDPLLSIEEKNKRDPRGGNGVLTCDMTKKEIVHAKRDIILGLNVPGYD